MIAKIILGFHACSISYIINKLMKKFPIKCRYVSCKNIDVTNVKIYALLECKSYTSNVNFSTFVGNYKKCSYAGAGKSIRGNMKAIMRIIRMRVVKVMNPI